MKHRFTSSKPDTSDPSLIGSASWNDTHVVGHTTISSNTTLNSTHDWIRAVGGTLGISLTLTTIDGATVEITKVDAAVGAVTIVGTINGQANWILNNQWQHVKLHCDGISWTVVSRT